MKKRTGPTCVQVIPFCFSMLPTCRELVCMRTIAAWLQVYEPLTVNANEANLA